MSSLDAAKTILSEIQAGRGTHREGHVSFYVPCHLGQRLHRAAVVAPLLARKSLAAGQAALLLEVFDEAYMPPTDTLLVPASIADELRQYLAL